jgi:hypothetical protein
MTSTLLGSVTKQYSGIASGVLNAMRQTGSAIGVALFGSLLSGDGSFIAGIRIALVIAATLALLRDRRGRRRRAAAVGNESVLRPLFPVAARPGSFFTPPRSAAPRAPARVAQARRIPSLP